MANYMSDNKTEEIHEYSIIGKDLTTFILQPGFVEGVIRQNKIFSQIENLYEEVFKNTKEFCVITWNGIPFRWSYINDLPYLIDSVIEVIRQIITDKKQHWQVDLKSKTFEAIWSFKYDRDIITIQSHFTKVDGGHQNALNTLSVLRIKKETFLSEWKLLIEQILQSLIQSENKIKGEALKMKINVIKEVNDVITKRALRYQYDKRIV